MPPSIREMGDGLQKQPIQLCIYEYSHLFTRLEKLSALLSPKEEERARRFKTERLQNEFRAGRGQLRRLLGEVLDRDPKSITFEFGELRKPFLRDHSLHFNVSHSKEFWGVAWSKKAPLGLDIEFKNPDLNYPKLAETFCCATELTYLKKAEGSEQKERFFQLWSAKESLIKKDGRGLSMPVKLVELSPLSNAQTGNLRVNTLGETGLDQPEELQIKAFDFHPEYSLALCTEGTFHTEIYFNKSPNIRPL